MPDEFERRIPFRLFLFGLAVLLLVITVLANNIAITTRYEFADVITAVGVLSSIALTATLAYLYHQMSLIQGSQKESSEKQTEILELQQEMQELEYKPKILVDAYELNDDGIELTLRNLGRGLAEHIGVRASIHVNNEWESEPQKEGDHNLYSEDDVFYRDPDTGTEFVSKITLTVRKQGDNFPSKRFRGGMLSPDEGKVEFYADVNFAYSHVGQLGISYNDTEHLFEYLVEQGVDDVNIAFDLVYCNELGESFAIPIMGKSGELQEGMGLSDIEDIRVNTTGTRNDVREAVERDERYPPPV